MMNRDRSVTMVLAALLPVMLLTVGNGCSSCKHDDDDKPAPSASAPAPAPTPVTPATVQTEEPDAGVDAGIDAGKPVGPGGGGGSGSLAKCCAALQQNVNSAPLDQKPYYMLAASQCNGMKNTSSGQQAFAQLRAYLQGAKMPGACK